MEEKQDQEVSPQGAGIQPDAGVEPNNNNVNIRVSSTRAYVPQQSRSGSTRVPTVRIGPNSGPSAPETKIKFEFKSNKKK